MAYKRTDRVNALLQRELGQLISEELTDPRISFATVTAVETTPDLRSARVHVSVLGPEDQGRETMRALEGARQHLRHEIGARTDLRFVPDLTFVRDRSAETAARISRLLREAQGVGESEAGPQASGLDEVVAALGPAARVAIVSHLDPDADTIGSGLALTEALRALGKDVSVHCADPVPDMLRFLPASEEVRRSPPERDVPVVVTVDLGDASRAGFDLGPDVTVLVIDHHASNTRFGAVNWVEPTSPATGEMVARLVDALGVRWTPTMATAVLVALMTDTGSFQFSNTDARAHELAGRLLEEGADLQSITYNVFRRRRFEAIRLWGLALGRFQREEGGRLVHTDVGPADLEGAGARDEDVSGLVEQIARSDGMRVALLFNWTHAGEVRMSCRTSPFEPLVDAAALMGAFGGGGHARAAGAVASGELDAVRDAVVAKARAALAAASASAR